MNILFVITRSDVMGGASVHLLDLAVGLKAKKYNVHILAGETGILHQQAAARNLSISTVQSLVRQIHPLKDVKAYFELTQAIAKFKPDLVHLHSSKAGLLGRLACKASGTPCVFTAHGWAFTEGVSAKRRFLYKWLERWAAPLAGKIITVSEYDRKLAIKNDVSAASHISLVHNGVADKAQEAGIVHHTEKPVVRLIMVARFEQPKDQQRLLKVLSTLKTLPCHIEFVGDGPELPNAKLLSKKLGVCNKVTFSGARSDVPLRLANADVFILLSHWEGLPLTILEAMSFGLPIIASDVGGVHETIDEKCGFLVPMNDDRVLSDALKSLVVSALLRADMGRAARERYLQYFTLQRMISDTEQVYREVVKST
ncbi:glycosyltransferase family 4 protein [Rheinheimera aquimaris]|uniref:Glycosyltransferase family 4 protein n=1 Tax=Rheinheimera aquimaris TaxID=412437 RepID=A0ABN1DAI1_9GAMM|nr:glycosyltransferase family 4 protein [Rheinheimera aquimaris]MCB5212570.1 glycosyltransferase family 4 protein [Rheinheimera aquimaris]